MIRSVARVGVVAIAEGSLLRLDAEASLLKLSATAIFGNHTIESSHYDSCALRQRQQAQFPSLAWQSQQQQLPSHARAHLQLAEGMMVTGPMGYPCRGSAVFGAGRPGRGFSSTAAAAANSGGGGIGYSSASGGNNSPGSGGDPPPPPSSPSSSSSPPEPLRLTLQEAVMRLADAAVAKVCEHSAHTCLRLPTSEFSCYSTTHTWVHTLYPLSGRGGRHGCSHQHSEGGCE